jgi:hypothetical protein
VDGVVAADVEAAELHLELNPVRVHLHIPVGRHQQAARPG